MEEEGRDGGAIEEEREGRKKGEWEGRKGGIVALLVSRRSSLFLPL